MVSSAADRLSHLCIRRNFLRIRTHAAPFRVRRYCHNWRFGNCYAAADYGYSGPEQQKLIDYVDQVATTGRME